MVYVTKERIVYKSEGINAIIPKGTIVAPATNLPKDSVIKFWANVWKGMTAKEKSWARNYGFGLRADEVKIK